MNVFNLNDINKQYDDMMYESRPTKYQEFMTDKYNIVHRQLYEEALNNLIEEIIDEEELVDEEGYRLSVKKFKQTHRCIEVKDDEYWKPSRVIIIDRNYPYKKHTYTLISKWNYHQSKNDKFVKDIKINSDATDWEIVKFDYVKGLVTLYSRVNDEEMIVDFDYLNENIELSDEMSRKYTIAAQLNR